MGCSCFSSKSSSDDERGNSDGATSDESSDTAEAICLFTSLCGLAAPPGGIMCCSNVALDIKKWQCCILRLFEEMISNNGPRSTVDNTDVTLD